MQAKTPSPNTHHTAIMEDFDDGLDAANIAAAQDLSRQQYMGRYTRCTWGAGGCSQLLKARQRDVVGCLGSS